MESILEQELRSKNPAELDSIKTRVNYMIIEAIQNPGKHDLQELRKQRLLIERIENLEWE